MTMPTLHPIAIALWGGVFGTVTLMVGGALIALAQGMRRLALMALLWSLMSGLFALAYLGWLPIADAQLEWRVRSWITVAAFVPCAFLLFAMLGRARTPGAARSAGNAAPRRGRRTVRLPFSTASTVALATVSAGTSTISLSL